MQTNISTERTYSVNFHRTGGKKRLGFSIAVTGDKKKKVLKEARELLDEAMAIASVSFDKYFTEGEDE